jgi:hypothetical protein
MESSAPNRIDPSRPGRFHRARALAVTVPARGTICPSDHGPFDPGFGQPATSR